MDINIHIGRKLRERRKKAGLTLEQVSTALHVTYQQVQKYESGQSKIPVNKLYEISLLLRLPIQYFFEDVDNFFLTPSTSSCSEDMFIAQKNNHHLNILLAESDPMDEFLTRKFLGELDSEIKIFCVHSDIQIINFLKRYSLAAVFPRPDLIFLDINISKKDNHALIAELKRDKILQDIPIIVLTNSIQRDDLIRIYRNGAASFICKAIDHDEIKRNLSVCIQYWGKVVVLPSIAWKNK